MIRSSIAGILAKCPDHRLRVTIDDGQQHPGCPLGVRMRIDSERQELSIPEAAMV